MWYWLHLGYSCLYRTSTAHVQTILVCRAHIQTVPFSKAQVQSVSHLYSQCPVCTSYLRPMSSLYWCPISKAKYPDGIPNVYTPHVQPLPGLYSPCSENTYSSNFDKNPSLQHLYCPCSVIAPYLRPCLVTTPYCLSMSCQNTTFPAHYQSDSHLYCPCPVKIPPLIP